MSRVPAITLGNAWPIMSEQDKVNVIADLCEHIQTLRKIRPPADCKDRISSLLGGPMRDAGLTIWEAVGPFSFDEYVDFLMNDVWIEDRPAKEERFRETLLRKLKTHGVFFAHADLHYDNIMVDKSSKTGLYTVTGIVDWKTAGWHPIYWEGFDARKDFTPFKEWNDFVPIFTGDHKEETNILMELASAGLR